MCVLLVVFCNAGEKRISSKNTCMKCPLGYYQPNRGEDDCIKCGDSQTTEQVGTYSKTGCIREFYFWGEK